MKQTFIPIDFNSMCTLNGSTLLLSEYYIDYAFYSEGSVPLDGMAVTFYDKYWTENKDEIICLDADLFMNKLDSLESWTASLKGNVYISKEIPSRKHYSAFIGANTYLMKDGNKDLKQKFESIGTDILGGISTFVFSPNSELPNFSGIIGLDSGELYDFFQFSNLKKVPLIVREDGSLTDENWVVRGGGNINEVEQ